ncbi:uncharacterized protein LOC108737523 isoform X1 [Agrilus planipennis]|uniref:Uncharacterized protein LOC108737523 isoform X1 n=1 Tax=Agrilus planipennis TaxID=224129 RepID=A0A1W4WPQ2_AGRPL|nr:uncharacterized protein LOC108737523 isoform X1 [Agrilus planipennis]
MTLVAKECEIRSFEMKSQQIGCIVLTFLIITSAYSRMQLRSSYAGFDRKTLKTARGFGKRFVSPPTVNNFVSRNLDHHLEYLKYQNFKRSLLLKWLMENKLKALDQKKKITGYIKNKITF